jgi:putative lipoic acid-binding regulatory protein
MGGMEEARRRPDITYPFRVPMKIIGRQEELRPDMVVELILAHLGPQPEGDEQHQANCKGAFISYTFWITLPHDQAETPLREAIQKLPGVVMQL